MTKVFDKINKISALIGGITLLLIAFFIRNAVASPYILLHNIEALEFLPPIWILGLAWYGSFFLLGAIGGQMITLKNLPNQMDLLRCKGGLFYLPAIAFSALWYLILFNYEAFFLAWLMCVASLVSLILCTSYWVRLLGGYAFAMITLIVGKLCLVIIHLMVMLHI